MSTLDTGDTDRNSLDSSLAGRYQIVRQLGRGAMAIVFLARDIALERNVAVKVLFPRHSSQPLRERFLSEARTAAGLSHPNIVPIHLVEAHDALVLFVMGYVDGETLRHQVERLGPLSAGEATRILQEIAWALGYAHQRGIVHRDVKPDNILIDRESGRAMVADFGIAHVAGRAGVTDDGLVIGTPHYMSPEQASGMSVDARTDVYAVGVLAYFLLTGKVPFDGPSAAAVLAKHLTEIPQPLGRMRPDLPRQLTDAVDRCLLKDPAGRYDSGEALATALGAARSFARETAPAVLRLMRGIDQFGIDTAGHAALGAVAIAIVAAPGTDSFRLVGSLAGVIAVVLWVDRVIGIGSAARTVLAGGENAVAIRRGFRERARAAPFARGPLHATGWWVIQSVALVVVSLYWLKGQYWLRLSTDSSLVEIAAAGLALVAPIVVARNLAAALLDRASDRPTGWDRLWAGWVGKYLLIAAGTGLTRRREREGSALLTEEMLADSVELMFRALPADHRAKIPDLLAVVEHLEGQAHALRARMDELGRARAEAAAATVRSHQADVAGMRDDVSRLAQPAARVIAAVEVARAAAAAAMTTVVAGLECIRLDLLRVRTGLANIGELTVSLESARQIGRDVDLLLAGWPVRGSS